MGGRSFVAVVLGAVLVGAVVAPGTASAHNSLTSSNPKNGATVARPPATVTLTFLSRLNPKGTKVTVSGPDGASVAAAAPVFAGKSVTVRLRPAAAGAYTVAYELVSSDGHPIKGRVRFTATTGNAPVAPSPSPSPSVPVAPAPPTGSPSAAATPSLAPASRERTGGSGVAGWIILGVLVVIAASLAGALIRRRAAR